MNDEAREADSPSVAPKGVSLSRLLQGVTQAISAAFGETAWVMVEVLKVTRRNGHCYLELTERDDEGRVLAKVSGTIWAREAVSVIANFERATGATLRDGIKLLVSARPVFKPQFGLSLEISAIDPSFTVGDLEARKNAIRAQLQEEGLYERNKGVASPWDLNSILVVSPSDAAGLGDFRKDADRLARHGVCDFTYVHSRFQGKGAAREIVAALSGAVMDRWKREGTVPDAVVIIRGGGAVNDLAWLNDYELAKFVCERRLPVLTGIGHERDSTIIDEVAHRRFDTPSKVIAGIEKLIVRRAREAKANAEFVLSEASRLVATVGASVDRLQLQIAAGARESVAKANQDSMSALGEVRLAALRETGRAGQVVATAFGQIRAGAADQMSLARILVPQHFAEIQVRATSQVDQARSAVVAAHGEVVHVASASAKAVDVLVGQHMASIAERALAAPARMLETAEALMREVAGQGPEKTLRRGFAVVRAAGGKAVSSVNQLEPDQVLEIQLRDGVFDARAENLKVKVNV